MFSHRLEVFLLSCDLSISALRLADQDAPTLPFVAEAYYKTLRETKLQLQAKASVSVGEMKEQLHCAAREVTHILKKREVDLVTSMARASAHVNPKYVYGEERFECPRSGDCFAAVVSDYLNGTMKGSQAEKTAMQTQRFCWKLLIFKKEEVGLRQT